MKDDKILESELNQNVDVGTAEDVEAVMKKYDRESNTRVWEGKPGVIVRWCSILFSLYSIYVTLFSTALPEVRLTIFLGTILILGYLNYPIKKRRHEGELSALVRHYLYGCRCTAVFLLRLECTGHH